MYSPSAGSVVVVHLEDAGVRVIRRQVVPFGEGDAVQAGGGEEHAVDEHPFGLEVRAKLGVIDVVLGAAHLFGVERPVPAVERELVADLPLQLLCCSAIALRAAAGASLPSRSATASGEPAVSSAVTDGGVGGKAEQVGALGAQPRDLEHEGAVVVLAALAAAGP